MTFTRIVPALLASLVLTVAGCGDPTESDEAKLQLESVQALLNAPSAELTTKLTEADVLVPNPDNASLVRPDCLVRPSGSQRGYQVDCIVASRSLMEAGRGVPALTAITLLDVTPTGGTNGVEWVSVDTSTRDTVFNENDEATQYAWYFTRSGSIR